MIELAITGGQTGADLGAWRAAKAAGIATGGWMPRGFKTEIGPRPVFAEVYGAREHASPAYPDRTRQNLVDADAAAGVVLLFDASVGSRLSKGTALALRICDEIGIHPAYVVGVRLRDCGIDYDGVFRPSMSATKVADHLRGLGVRTLFVGGNRESGAPGIESYVEQYCATLFRAMAAPQQP